MRQVHDTVRQPVITEKTTIQKDVTGVYCFKVDVRANKIEIAKAVEELFGVKVAEVRTSRVHGKFRRMGRFTGRNPDWKKAWVRLAPGEKEIEYFEAT
jgi:large subunit ribosomal protein L23